MNKFPLSTQSLQSTSTVCIMDKVIEPINIKGKVIYDECNGKGMMRFDEGNCDDDEEDEDQSKEQDQLKD
ncbi:MAG: hypothetical protein EZS28_046412 [Streblomastix strix]|uniref:Uncharacterized protein n=1 Tax=Streblomastix strix TaxID=222440 RepID=A0A5J4TKN5_9EUKA|nr:MAG: hypothetical protein EZS28_046412 [Streblomastix strix]